MVKRLQSFLPELREKHISEKGTSGIRTLLVDRKGNFAQEAVELETPLSLHVLNYNSPGATGAPAYAARVVSALEERGLLKAKRKPLDGQRDFRTMAESFQEK